MVYFHELAEKYKSTTLWSTYSMLKTTINNKQNNQNRELQGATSFSEKEKCRLPVKKKSQILTGDQVEKFVNEASDSYITSGTSRDVYNNIII